MRRGVSSAHILYHILYEGGDILIQVFFISFNICRSALFKVTFLPDLKALDSALQEVEAVSCAIVSSTYNTAEKAIKAIKLLIIYLYLLVI